MKQDELEALVAEQISKTLSSVKQESKIALKKMHERIENIEKSLGINDGNKNDLLNFFQSQLKISQINQKESKNQNTEKTFLEQINDVLALKQDFEKSQAIFLQDLKENLVYKSELMKLQSRFEQLESNKNQNTQNNQNLQFLNNIKLQIDGLQVQLNNQESIINNLKQNHQQVQDQKFNHQHKNSFHQDNTQQQPQQQNFITIQKFQTPFIQQQQQQFPIGGIQQQQCLPFLETQQGS